jgi:alanyl-tRNA synthetase
MRISAAGQRRFIYLITNVALCKTVEESDRMKDELIARLSHDVSAYCNEILQLKAELEAMQKHTGELKRSLQNQDDLVCQLRELQSRHVEYQHQIQEIDSLNLKNYEQSLYITHYEKGDKDLK